MPATPVAASEPPRWATFPAVTLILTGVLAMFLVWPRVWGNPGMRWAFLGAVGALLVWQAALAVMGRGRVFEVVLVRPMRTHVVQGFVQLSILAYWGWYWREIYAEMPLIGAQLIYIFTFDALMSWTRGRPWKPGFGPLPIVFSTNFFLWFVDDAFFLQFLMISSGAVGKEFIRWKRDGRWTHIFNPSALGLTLASVWLIATGTTDELTWARDLATTIDRPPHIFVFIFLVGLVVQYMFAVTLMTLAATAVLAGMGALYTQVTGVYHFVDINISAAVFLGLHLLMTDPATSPRTNTGRLIFGAMYGVGVYFMFDLLTAIGAPVLYSKLLVVPLMNLFVPLIERLTRRGPVGAANLAWETALRPRAMNLVHMSVWAVLFVGLLVSGYIQAPHPGNSIPFWKRAFAEGRHNAHRGLEIVTGAHALGERSGAAYNERGLFSMEGNVPGIPQSNGRAARYFGEACELGDPSGCSNVAVQFLFLGEARAEEDVTRAFDRLEALCTEFEDPRACYLLGYAHESGRGRPASRELAIGYYTRAGIGDPLAAKGLARLGLTAGEPGVDVRPLLPALVHAGEAGDAESCWYLAYMYRDGVGLKQDTAKARALLERACSLGYEPACAASVFAEPPPYSHPQVAAPGWATAFPIGPVAAGGG